MKKLLFYILWTNFSKEKLSLTSGNPLKHTVIRVPVIHDTKFRGMWQVWVQEGTRSYQFRPLRSTVLTTICSLARAVRSPKVAIQTIGVLLSAFRSSV